MQFESYFSLFTLIFPALWPCTLAVNLEGRDRKDIKIDAGKEATSTAQVTTFPTVPAITGPNFAFGAFSSVYPSGWTTPALLPVEVTSSTSCTTSRSSSVAGLSEDDYLQSMCAPHGSQGAEFGGGDPDFPCNRVANSTYICVYNATAQDVQNDPKVTEVSPQAQQECFCPNGRGHRIWEDVEGCNECIRLHGGEPFKTSSDQLYHFLPTGFVRDLSSAYCAQETPRGWDTFASSFSAMHSASYGSITGGTDLLISRTAVSNYFTETSGRSQATITATDSGTDNTSRSSRATAPVANAQSSSTGSVTAAIATGAGGSLRTPGLLSAGIVGILWLW